jgi:hypothetical protein
MARSVQDLVAQHEESYEPRKPHFVEEYVDYAILVLGPDGQTVEEVNVVQEGIPIYEADLLAATVRKSNRRPFSNYRFSLGTLLKNGRFVPGFSPRVADQRLGQPVFDNTIADIITLAQKVEAWHQREVAFQTDNYIARLPAGDKAAKAPPKVGTKGHGKIASRLAPNPDAPKSDTPKPEDL